MILALGILAAIIAYWYIGVFTCIMFMIGNPMARLEYFSTVLRWPQMWFMFILQLFER